MHRGPHYAYLAMHRISQGTGKAMCHDPHRLLLAAYHESLYSDLLAHCTPQYRDQTTPYSTLLLPLVLDHFLMHWTLSECLLIKGCPVASRCYYNALVLLRVWFDVPSSMLPTEDGGTASLLYHIL
ncbi:hypothetical protein HAX54_018167 [Datura stramonium]|uniref:Uncharacterized protein n=1 Tax=Datura stramonium TaxID=4076 RepID=A0ABS8UM10_DATST|nr:hypothetical protein [Datura stramonium]